MKGTTRTPGWHPKETASQLHLYSRADCFINATATSRPEAMGWPPRVAGPLTTSLRELWVSGLLPPGNGGTCKGAANQKPTTCQRGLTQYSQAGNPKRKRPNCHRKEELSKLRGWHNCSKCSKVHVSWRRGATGFFMLSRQLLTRGGRLAADPFSSTVATGVRGAFCRQRPSDYFGSSRKSSTWRRLLVRSFWGGSLTS